MMKTLQYIGSLLGGLLLTGCFLMPSPINSNVKQEVKTFALNYLKDTFQQDFKVLEIDRQTQGGWGDIVEDMYVLQCQMQEDERVTVRLVVKAPKGEAISITNATSVQHKYRIQKNRVDFLDKIEPIVASYYPSALTRVVTTNNEGRYFTVEIALHAPFNAKDVAQKYIPTCQRIEQEIYEKDIIVAPNSFGINFHLYKDNFDSQLLKKNSIDGDYYVSVEKGNIKTRLGYASNLSKVYKKYLNEQVERNKGNEYEGKTNPILPCQDEPFTEDINADGIREWIRYSTAIWNKQDNKTEKILYYRINIFTGDGEEYTPK